MPLRRGLHPIEASDKESRRRFGIGFKELVSLVFADVNRHASEKGWPPRVYALLDEPRPEHHDIESSQEIAKLFTFGAPSPSTLSR